MLNYLGTPPTLEAPTTGTPRSRRWRAVCPSSERRVGGVPEVIEHGISGFLHDPDAVDDMAASVMRLLTSPDLHRTMADAACRRVRERFGADRVVPMYEAAYERLLASV